MHLNKLWLQHQERSWLPQRFRRLHLRRSLKLLAGDGKGSEPGAALESSMDNSNWPTTFLPCLGPVLTCNIVRRPLQRCVSTLTAGQALFYYKNRRSSKVCAGTIFVGSYTFECTSGMHISKICLQQTLQSLCQTQSTLQPQMTIYTNDSKSKNEAGVEVFSNQLPLNLSIALGKYTTVF